MTAALTAGEPSFADRRVQVRRMGEALARGGKLWPAAVSLLAREVTSGSLSLRDTGASGRWHDIDHGLEAENGASHVPQRREAVRLCVLVTPFSDWPVAHLQRLCRHRHIAHPVRHAIVTKMAGALLVLR